MYSNIARLSFFPVDILFFGVLSIRLIIRSLAFFNLSNTVGWGSELELQSELELLDAKNGNGIWVYDGNGNNMGMWKKFFINTQMYPLSCWMGMKKVINWELLDAKNGNGIWVYDGNGNNMGMGMKSLKLEGFRTKNPFPHVSVVDIHNGDL